MDKPKKPHKDRMYEWMVEHWDELDPDNQRRILDLAERLAAENDRVSKMTPAERRAHYIRKNARILGIIAVSLASIALGWWLASLFG